jgi:N,N'-diacetyllegionaminate synthase
VQFDNSIRIDKNEISKDKPPYIIAEAGVSHFGSIEKALRLCDLAKASGADSVKFQIFNVDKMISKVSKEWRERLAPRQMSADDYKVVKAYCDKIDITFFATAHDEESLDKLLEMNVSVLKVGSGEKGNFKFLKKIIDTKLPLIISIGMYTEIEVRELIDFFEKYKKTDIVILHCVTQYPALPENINLSTINWLSKEFKVLSGYSDHTSGHHIAEASVVFGATVVEKHISLDFNVPNAQDWKVSCGPHDLKDFITNIHEIHSAIGYYGKTVNLDEVINSKWATKGLYTTKDLQTGHIITELDVDLKRPATNVMPKDFDKFLGKKINKKIQADYPIDWEDIDNG